MIVLIDNYDSFSYNLVQLIGSLTKEEIQVYRNDEKTVEEIEKQKPSHIILSPGPGKPSQAGICEEIVKKLGGSYPILGVCLGHQAICESFGATITYAKELMHGKQSEAKLSQNEPIFEGLEQTIKVARYHSLVALKETIPDELKIIAETESGEVMAVRHREKPIYGFQFHPESVLTPNGTVMMKNFLQIK